MSILVVNNYGQYNHRIQRTLHYLKIESELVSNELSLNDISDKNPIGLILGGGPSIERIGNCIDYINEIDLPILGICLGHQLIGKAFGGEVCTAQSQSYAQIEIELLNKDNLFKNLESPTKVWASHKDEIKKLPKDFEVIAKSNICNIESMKHKNKPIFGIQFHPEVQHTEHGPQILENFYNICKQYNSQ